MNTEMEKKEYTVFSSTFYNSITSVDFYPREDLAIKPAKKKGDYEVIKKGWLRKPVAKKIEDDLYNYGSRCQRPTLLTAEEYARYSCLKYDANKKIFYRQARVIINYGGKKYITERFDTTEEAEQFMQNLRTKCSTLGNKLL